MHTILAAERVGPAYTQDGMLLARRKTREAIAAIAARIRAGMLEEDAVAMAKQVLLDMGLVLSWHPTRVCFGRNTTKPMKRASEPGVVLQENDIFFLDIAPRVDAWEGDGGATFTVGDSVAQADYARCARDAEQLFHRVRAVWQREGLTGQALYGLADAEARKLGWELTRPGRPPRVRLPTRDDLHGRVGRCRFFALVHALDTGNPSAPSDLAVWRIFRGHAAR